MPTTRNWENSTVSTTTDHFSQYVIDLGGYTESKALKNVAGGGYYNAVSAYDLAHYHGSEMYIPPEYQGEDTDGDGIPDLVEEYGLLPNGDRINSSPYLKDTDGDGLDDIVIILFPYLIFIREILF